MEEGTILERYIRNKTDIHGIYYEHKILKLCVAFAIYFSTGELNFVRFLTRKNLDWKEHRHPVLKFLFRTVKIMRRFK